MFRNFIFDWSGTLVDDMGPVIDATNVVFGKYGLAPLDREGFRRSFRLPYHEFYAEYLPEVGIVELEAHFRPAFDASLVPVTILPHTLEKLQWCAAHGIRCFVLTAMDAIAFQRQLDEFGLRPYFEATYAGVTDKRHLIHSLMESHGLDPAETAFVGDMTHDVETARHGGIASIAVLTGYNHPEVLAAVRPDITVPDLGVLRNLLERRSKESRPISTVGGLIHDGKGHVLMLRTHKWGGRWGIPGGKIERGETTFEALKREIREETGLIVEEVQLVMVQDCIDSPEFMRPEHFILLNYLAKTSQTNVILNDEAEEYRWLAAADALALNLNQPTRTLLLEVMELELLQS